MTEKTTYICDICNAEYNEKDDAKACELTHKNTCIIVKKTYRRCAVYPVEIVVQMENGDRARYVCAEERGSGAYEATGSGDRLLKGRKQ